MKQTIQQRIADIPVTIIRKPIKHLYITVKAPHGNVVVSAPQKMTDAQIETLVQAKREWIARKQHEIQARKPQTGKTPDIVDTPCQIGARVLLWGEQCELEKPVDHLKEWYRQKLKEKIAEQLPKLEAKTGLYCNEWRVKDMKTRWGSCNTKAKRIWLNLKLVHYPEACLEYVMLHELAHLNVPNHSAAFYAILDEHMPDWQERRTILNAKA